MDKVYKIIVVTFCFIFSTNFYAQIEKYNRVKIFLNSENNLEKLSSFGIEIDHGIHKKGQYFISEFSQKEIKSILNSNFKIEILREDVVQYFLDQNKFNTDNKLKRNLDIGCFKPRQFKNPTNFKLGSMGGYFTHKEMGDQLDLMIKLYPNLISKKEEIGKSTEGVPIYLYTISANRNDTVPKVLYNALHHAREPASLSQLIYFMWYVLENYNSDKDVNSVLNNTQLFFVPCVNPDGYIFNSKTNPSGGGMWRKNRRNNGSDYGVDLNRNYGYKWGFDNTGSSPATTSEAYRGISAFSEPETKAMKTLCEKHKFNFSMNYHTFGNFLITPWGYSATEKFTEKSLFDAFSTVLTKENNYKFGSTYETLSYTANGGSDDWMYGESITKNKIYSFTPEVGHEEDGFWPQANKIINICNDNIYQNLRCAQLSTNFLSFEDKSDVIVSSNNGYFKYQTSKYGISKKSNYSIKFIPLKNIKFKDSLRNLINPILLSSNLDSNYFTLTKALNYGDTISFIVDIKSSSFVYSDTIIKIFGKPIFLVNEKGSDIKNWTTTSWGISSNKYITDSPIGNYKDNTTASIIYNNKIDLTKSVFATLSFNAKWMIEKGFDYLQIQVSEDDKTSWKPLCGKYTHPSKLSTIYGQSIYDGNQLNWVKEEINLKDYLGKNIYLRFVIFSDFANNNDGFYFNDLLVNSIVPPVKCFDTINVVTCENYKWYDTLLTKSGKYIHLNDVNKSNCDSTFNVLNLSINKPNLKISFNSSNDTLFSNIKEGNFRWIDCLNNSIIKNESLNYLVPLKNGQYSLIIESNKCLDTSDCIIFKTNQVQKNELEYSFEITPNPFSQTAFVDVNILQSTSVQIDLITYLGVKKEVFKETVLEKGKHTINISKSELNLAAGIYFINIYIDNNQYTQKISIVE